MGFLDRIFRRQRPNAVQQAIHKSSMTMAEVSRADLTDGYKKYFVDRNKPSILQPEDPRRRAVASISNRLSIQGLWRENFDRDELDRLAQNVTYALCEKAVMDYFTTTEWWVHDGENKTVDSAEELLDHPNSQDNFNSMIVATIPDVLRYDAGCIVKSFNLFDQVAELKAYSGPEFLPEVDDEIQKIDGEFGQTVYGIYSHGFVRRWWQHSRPGVFIPFLPAEVVYIKMYPRSDSPFGRSFLQVVKWQLECLTDGTAAAGMTFANGMSAGMVWNHSDMTGPEQLAEQMAEEEKNRGPMKFNGVIHTFGDDTITPLTPTMVDMQWYEGQKYISTIVWALFGFPASEFIEGDANRATAYIGRNITKSRMLAPLLRRYEAYINTQILPDLEGYRPDWRFEFVEAVDRDDELKQTQIDQGKMTISQGYYQMGVALPLALKLAGVDEEMIDAVKEAETAAGPLDADLPTYADTAAGQTDDGPITEQYTGTSNDQEHEQSQDGIQKADDEHWITSHGTHLLVQGDELMAPSKEKVNVPLRKKNAGRVDNEEEKRLDKIKSMGKEWKSGDGKNHRVYFKDLYDLTGFKFERYGTGNISSATLGGKKISNSKARRLSTDLDFAKVYYDVNEKEFKSEGLSGSQHDLVVNEIKRRIGSGSDTITKSEAGKQYVTSSNPAPKGAKVIEGPRGGEYWISDQSGKSATSPKNEGEVEKVYIDSPHLAPEGVRVSRGHDENWNPVFYYRRTVPPTSDSTEEEDFEDSENTFIPAKSLIEATKYTQGVLKIETVDTKGLGLDAVNLFNKQMTVLSKRWPGVLEGLQVFGSTQFGDEMITHAEINQYTKKYINEGLTRIDAEEKAKRMVKPQETGGDTLALSQSGSDTQDLGVSGIYLNSASYGSRDVFEKTSETVRDCARSGFHPYGTGVPESIITHEFAHCIQSYLIQHDTKNHAEWINELYQEAKTQGLAEFLDAKNVVSKYASYNLWEFFAESITEYIHSPKPRQIAKAVGDRLEKEMMVLGGPES